MFFYTVLLNDNQLICLSSGLSGQRQEPTAVVTNSPPNTHFSFGTSKFATLLLSSPVALRLSLPWRYLPLYHSLLYIGSPLYSSTFCLPTSVTSHNLLLLLHFYWPCLLNCPSPTLPQWTTKKPFSLGNWRGRQSVLPVALTW